MSDGGEVKWYGGQVVSMLKNATAELLTKTAEQALGHARINLRDSGRVDTGFLINSGYVVGAPGTDIDPGNAYDPMAVKGRSAAPQATPPSGGAIVGFSAEYALWQEIRKSYLLTGVEQAKKDMARIAKEAGK